jgi:hypothetical protein
MKNLFPQPGFPVFGTKKKSTVLQGLSTTGDKFCDSEVQSTVPISKHKDWIESVIYGIFTYYLLLSIDSQVYIFI